jgi:amino acid transporter
MAEPGLPAQAPVQGLREAVRRKPSFIQTFKAVAWSFFGVRRGADYQEDVEKLNPVHLLAAGILAAVAFVVGLLTLVQWVLSSGVAK